MGNWIKLRREERKLGVEGVYEIITVDVHGLYMCKCSWDSRVDVRARLPFRLRTASCER